MPGQPLPIASTVARLPAARAVRESGIGPIFGRVHTDLVPGNPVATGSRGWKLWDQDTAASALVDAIDGAQHVVNAEFFGITDDGKGEHVVDALAAAARRGVEVNVIADLTSRIAPPLGSFRRLEHELEGAGAHVLVSDPNPIDIGTRRAPGLTNTDHRKVVTVDGTTALTGGMNLIALTDDYRDSVVELHGLDAARLSAEQLARWRDVGGAVSQVHAASVRDALRGAPLVPTDPNAMRIVVNAPDQHRFEVTEQYRDLIRSAQHRLWISSPAFTDQEVMADISAAARRGVDVRLVAPGQDIGGIRAVSEMTRANLVGVVAAGGKAYEIPEVLHRKAIISDDQVIAASYNITKRSRSADHEIGVRTSDPEFVDAIAGVLTSDMARAKLFDPAARSGVLASVTDWLRDRGFSY